ncbi:MAG TPA: hypothetical protein DCP20_02405 [Coriobacteriia bacterium]|nr:MAG: Uncharacterized protein XD74_1948 [Actinobacteria bacterium 66_15]HAL29552.1 hypothetical protein [Coriobacteriia bacterium]
MADYVQISAQISEATRSRLDQYARETGLKKGRLIEDAIQAHLDALDEVPAEYLIPHRVVVDTESWERIVAEMDRPVEPTPVLRRLMRSDAD